MDGSIGAHSVCHKLLLDEILQNDKLPLSFQPVRSTLRRFAAIPAHPQKQYTRRWRLYYFCGFYYPIREVIPIAIYHCNIGIVSRGKGKSAVAAAAYRSGEENHKRVGRNDP